MSKNVLFENQTETSLSKEIRVNGYAPDEVSAVNLVISIIAWDGGNMGDYMVES